MLRITQGDLLESGGYLRALIYKSADYLEQIIGRQDIRSVDDKEAQLRRIIVHAGPHLDEYVADWLFTASLSPATRAITFEEQVLTSSEGDPWSELAWPSSAVFGLGGTVSANTKPLILFDEHSSDQSRTDVSCCQMVATALFGELPNSVSTLLREANVIDAHAGAHPQHLGNLIKSMHGVRVQLGSDPATGEQVTDFLSAEHKRAIIHACLTAVVYCLENNIDLVKNPGEKEAAIRSRIDRYLTCTRLSQEPSFADVTMRLGKWLFNQSNIFGTAILTEKERNGGEIKQIPLLDATGKKVPQLLLLARTIFACEKCWGSAVADLIAIHLFETLYRSSFWFRQVELEINALFGGSAGCRQSRVGAIERVKLEPLRIRFSAYCDGRTIYFDRDVPLMVIGLVPATGFFNANKAAMNYINEQNRGVGIVFVNDTTLGTKSVHNCENTPLADWDRFCDLLNDREPACWHRPMFEHGPADYILNGTAAHQERERSSIGFGDVLRLARKTFYRRHG